MLEWAQSIRGKFFILTLMVTFFLLTGNGLGLYNNWLLARSSDQIADRNLPLINAAHRLKLAVVQVQQWLTDISATRGRDGLNDGFDQAATYAKQFHQELALLYRLDPEIRSLTEGIRPAFDSYYDAGQGMAKAYVSGGPAQGNRMMSSFDATAEEIGAHVDRILEHIQQRVASHAELQKNRSHQASWGLALMSILVFAALIALYVFVSRRLHRLSGLIPHVQRIGAGDLSNELVAEGADEVSKITRSIEHMRRQLSDIVGQIHSTNQHLVTNTRNLSESVEKAGRKASEQQNATIELSTTTNQMTASAVDIASNISEVARAAQKSQGQTRCGQQTLDGAISRLGNLVEQIDQTSRTISLLEQHSTDIAGILDVIRSIAEQTNLLALNAAIEAARAGEQGRGFAVVADEVRSLASRTQQSTEEIHAMIEKLITGVHQAVTSMSSSADLATETLDEAGNAVEAFRAIVTLIDQVSDHSTLISGTAQDQTGVSEQIVEHVNLIREHAESTTGCMAQAMSAVDQMSAHIHQLNQAASRFRKASTA